MGMTFGERQHEAKRRYEQSCADARACGMFLAGAFIFAVGWGMLNSRSCEAQHDQPRVEERIEVPEIMAIPRWDDEAIGGKS